MLHSLCCVEGVSVGGGKNLLFSTQPSLCAAAGSRQQLGRTRIMPLRRCFLAAATAHSFGFGAGLVGTCISSVGPRPTRTHTAGAVTAHIPPCALLCLEFAVTGASSHAYLLCLGASGSQTQFFASVHFTLALPGRAACMCQHAGGVLLVCLACSQRQPSTEDVLRAMCNSIS